jgi:DNA-binding XRE family transcriptional regulator
MRQKLNCAREEAGITQRETATAIGVSERMYQHIENGTREGKGYIWDALEALFEYKIPQRELRENDTQPNFNTTGKEDPAVAAAELSEVAPSVMVKAALDLQDGRADTPEGRRVLELMEAVGGAALG